MKQTLESHIHNRTAWAAVLQNYSKNEIFHAIRIMKDVYRNSPTNRPRILSFVAYLLTTVCVQQELLLLVQTFSMTDKHSVILKSITALFIAVTQEKVEFSAATYMLSHLATPDTINYIRTNDGIMVLAKALAFRLGKRYPIVVQRAVDALILLHNKGLLLPIDYLHGSALIAFDLGNIAYRKISSTHDAVLSEIMSNSMNYFKTITYLCPLIAILELEDPSNINQSLDKYFATEVSRLLQYQKNKEREYSSKVYARSLGKRQLCLYYGGYADCVIEALEAMTKVPVLKEYLMYSDDTFAALSNEGEISLDAIVRIRNIMRILEGRIPSFEPEFADANFIWTM